MALTLSVSVKDLIAIEVSGHTDKGIYVQGDLEEIL